MPETQHLLVLGVEQGLVHFDPTISLHVIEVDDMLFQEGTVFGTIPIQRLKIPVRIGRTDLNQDPAILPELNLGGILANLQPGIKPVVSRLHAALQLKDGRPVLKPLVDHDRTTWVRHTGDKRLVAIPPNTERLLEHRDTIVLGHPKSRHVSLRVIFSHP
ncbi:MAG: hypothetical protein NUV84_01720 [Candidatus Uhrbacteria bacterium]|nr:hypothetical protein [Candidatus Uhrbacteria bacterium]